MSQAVEDIAGTFQGMVRNVGTTFGLVVGVAVVFYTLPALFQLTAIVKSLTGQK